MLKETGKTERQMHNFFLSFFVMRWHKWLPWRVFAWTEPAVTEHISPKLFN